jgi:type I site-specific restriction endonuclease
MAEKEAKARIKINKLLEESGWSFFDTDKGKATIKLESSIKMDDLGEDFENSKSGFIDFLLVDENQNPILVLEAKKESLNPLVGKEQARNYAKSQKVKFIILSNGTLHYLWNIETGNPEQIQVFPTLESIKQYYQFQDSLKTFIKTADTSIQIPAIKTMIDLTAKEYMTSAEYIRNKNSSDAAYFGIQFLLLSFYIVYSFSLTQVFEHSKN